MNQKSLGKAILALFIGIAFISCAGKESSVQKKVDENPNLFKAGTPVADSLVSMMPEFARSVFKEVFDSIPGEYYYHATDGRIDTLFQKEGGQYKPIVSIAYDSLDGQDNYELRKGNGRYNVKGGALVEEVHFPKYHKKYWNNGLIKELATGLLYKDDQGFLKMDSGHSETYFENGKTRQQNDWNNKQCIAQKEWNENGILIKEWVFPEYYKEYWDNGNPQKILTGNLYRDNQGVIQVDSGLSEIYFESGKINQQNVWRDKQGVTSKQWNENGVLIIELEFPKYLKECWENGNPKGVMTGILYRDDRGILKMDSGHSETFFENGKIEEQNDWKDKQLVTNKSWNENGALIEELDFPNYHKKYWNNGKTKTIATGILYRDDQGIPKVDSGHSESYFENGKIKQQIDWKNKQPVTNKSWNENGVLIAELDFPKYLKECWENGKPKQILTGSLYRDNQGVILVDSGHSETFFENGKIEEQNDWKDKQLVTRKKWNGNGVLITEWNFPKYVKEYHDNGKLKVIGTGILYRNEQGFPKVDSGHSEFYFENGTIKQQNDWKDKQLIASKTWNESGVLIQDFVFHKYGKDYWNNGKPKNIVTGTVYINDQGSFSIDSGHMEAYYENGNIKMQADVKDKQFIASKQWSENGTLTGEMDLPAGYLNYYDENGIIKAEVRGLFTFMRIADAGEIEPFKLESGYAKAYNNGKLQFQLQYEENKLVSQKFWNEDGTLSKEGDATKGFHKEYFPNGKLSREISGKFHYDDNEAILEKGSDKRWYENGKLASHKIYKAKRLAGKTEWHENGNMSISVELPNRYREFYEDGKIKVEATGTIVEENESFRIKDGTYNEYSPDGEITYSATYKDFQMVSEKN